MSDQEQLSTEQEREYVEAAWENFYTTFDEVGWCAVFGLHRTAAYITEKSAIHAALLSTKEHKGELKRRIYAISLLKLIYAQGGQGEWKPVDWKQDQEALEQVVAREEAALADLLRGWREKGDGNGRG